MPKIKENVTTMRETAKAVFQACESRKGWDACRSFCHPDPTFSAQAEALRDTDTLKEYTEFMQAQYNAMPDIEYEVTSRAVDEDRGNVCVCVVLSGTHTGEGGPMPPTGKSIESDYAYLMEFREDKIEHVTKSWNAHHVMKQLG